MPLNDQETLACLRILIAIVKADGVLHDEEKISLMGAFEDLTLPEGTALETLLQEETRLDAQLALLSNAGEREQLLHSAFAIAYADGECAPEERRLLNRICTTWEIGDDTKLRLETAFRASSSPPKGKAAYKAMQITDATRREQQITEDIRKTSIIASLLGAFFVPGVAIFTDLAVLKLQQGLARDIGRYYGRELDAHEARSLLRGFGVGSGVVIATSNLLKFFPGWGSAFGALAAFSTTQAVGHVMDHHFAQGHGKEADLDGLRARFKAAKKEAKKTFDEERSAIETRQVDTKDALTALTARLESGEIDQHEFEQRVAEL